MSDLKHQPPEELRRRIASVQRSKEKLRSQWEADEIEAARLLARAAKCRKKWHDLGQIETWARIYLARKELTSPE